MSEIPEVKYEWNFDGDPYSGIFFEGEENAYAVDGCKVSREKFISTMKERGRLEEFEALLADESA